MVQINSNLKRAYTESRVCTTLSCDFCFKICIFVFFSHAHLLLSRLMCIFKILYKSSYELAIGVNSSTQVGSLHELTCEHVHLLVEYYTYVNITGFYVWITYIQLDFNTFKGGKVELGISETGSNASFQRPCYLRNS